MSLPIGRRRFLRGAGGVAVGLPFLPSLDSRRASAQTPVYPKQRYLLWMTHGHGGAYESAMFPADSLLDQSSALFSDHAIRWGRLQASTNGGQTTLSPVLRAATTEFPAALVNKLNVLRGIDVPFYIAHHTGGHLGNYARCDGANANTGSDGGKVGAFPRPTIDQIMAWSPNFYGNASGIRERTMVAGVGGAGRLSYGFSNPAAGTGTIQENTRATSSLELFDRIFLPEAGTPEPPAPTRPLIVDRVLANYHRLRDGNRRISGADRQRVEDHVARLAELQRKLQVAAGGTPPNIGCGAGTTRPSDDANKHTTASAADYTAYGQLFLDVMITAFACGTSRIGILGHASEHQTVGYAGSWHQDVAHNWQTAANQQYLVSAYQSIFANSFLYAARKLDEIEDTPGVRLLDDALVAWTQESGMATHQAVSVPIITAGSAGGFFKTGLYADYARRSAAGLFSTDAPTPLYLGLTYNQWLATVMQSMGVARSEFELWGHRGYGVPFVGSNTAFKRHYVDTSSRYFTMASDRLPVISA